MNERPPEPKFLIEWRRIALTTPKCCHTCDHFTLDGDCLEFDSRPPDSFTETQGQCLSWQRSIPF